MCLPCCMTAGLQPARPQHEASYDSAVRQVVRGRSQNHIKKNKKERSWNCLKKRKEKEYGILYMQRGNLASLPTPFIFIYLFIGDSTI